MGTVTGINADDEIIETLKEWLVLAKQGRLTALTACLIIDNTVDSCQHYGPHSALELLAMTHLSASQIVDAITESDEDDDM